VVCSRVNFTFTATRASFWPTLASRGPLSASWQAGYTEIMRFCGSCPAWTAWKCASSCGPDVVILGRWSPSALLEWCPVVAERYISRKTDWTQTADCVASYVDGSKACDFCHVEALEGARTPSPQDCRESCGKISDSCDKRTLALYQGVFESTPCRALPCAVEWMENASKTYC